MQEERWDKDVSYRTLQQQAEQAEKRARAAEEREQRIQEKLDQIDQQAEAAPSSASQDGYRRRPLSYMRKKELVAECQERGIDAEGTVKELRDRLKEARRLDDADEPPTSSLFS